MQFGLQGTSIRQSVLTGVCGSSTELAVLSLACAALGMWDHLVQIVGLVVAFK